MTSLDPLLQSIKERADIMCSCEHSKRPEHITCRDRGLCVTEYCSGCFANARGEEEKRLVEAVRVLAEELQARKHKLSTAQDADQAIQRAEEILKGV